MIQYLLIERNKPAIEKRKTGMDNNEQLFSPQRQMKVVILGCGRVGATLATMMDRAGHTVSIIDQSNESFSRLPVEFKGELIVGNGVNEDVLMRAGIQEADAFAAVTNGD